MKNLNQKGFTLIEIIIAIGILASMTMTITDITTGITIARDRTKVRNDTRHSISNGLSKMMDDIRQAFHANKRFHGKEGAYKTGFFGDSSVLDFSTMSNVHFVKNNIDTDQIQVGYYLKSNDNGSSDLIRRQTDFLMNDVSTGGISFVLIKNVRELSFEYYDSNKESWVGGWDTDSVSSAGRLPQMVKISITVLGESVSEDEDDFKEYYYELQVPIAMYRSKIKF